MVHFLLCNVPPLAPYGIAVPQGQGCSFGFRSIVCFFGGRVGREQICPLAHFWWPCGGIWVNEWGSVQVMATCGKILHIASVNRLEIGENISLWMFNLHWWSHASPLFSSSIKCDPMGIDLEAEGGISPSTTPINDKIWATENRSWLLITSFGVSLST